MDDAAFDALLPGELRHLSHVEWTPLRVAVQAARLLAPGPGARVLDIGAGVGKVCAIGALATAAHWVGVERRPALVAAARDLARHLGVAERATFILGDAFSLAWTAFDALYFFNPFELPLFPAERRSDVEEFPRAIAETERRLVDLRAGTRVVTLYGFGGAMPACFELVRHERISASDGDLACWTRR